MDEQLLHTLGCMTYGIYVLTTCHRKTINGMIASWVSQVSYDPPLVLIAIHPNRFSHRLIQKSGAFALHLLYKNQKDLLARFKGPDPGAKFADLEWSRSQTGCPILKDCLGYMECTVKAMLQPGNHTLFIGEVLEARLFAHEEPLTTLDYKGRYVGKD
ncbi:MAG: flavin reductase family protein [Deltaproteobacteria bacterium]|jgi:flavin reductase (DIM6/NTAB) family NADH-FMN oxidoreductase RutF